MHRQNCKNPGGRSCCLCLAVVGEVSPAGCMAYTCLPATWHVPEPETARSARKIDQRLAGAAGHCQMHVCSTCQRKSASLAAWKRCESQRPTLSVVVLPMQGNAGSALCAVLAISYGLSPHAAFQLSLPQRQTKSMCSCLHGTAAAVVSCLHAHTAAVFAKCVATRFVEQGPQLCGL